jgi:hypothetical protein
MTTAASNFFKKELFNSTINGATDTFKIILMQSGFIYNKSTMGTYADVSASELPTALGYTVEGATLAGVAISQDNTLALGKIAWSNPSWVATGGDLTASGAIIYDDTHATNCIVGYIDFDGDVTTLSGGTFTLANVYAYIKTVA